MIKSLHGDFMTTNENMIDTERMAIKFDGGKAVIKKHYLQDTEHYLVTFSKDFSIFFNNKEIDFSNSILKLYNLSFIENGVKIKGVLIKNMSLKTIYFATDAGTIDTYEASFIPEPEEPVSTIDLKIPLNGVTKIILDPNMINDMINSNIITNNAQELSRYGLIPRFSLITQNKIKLKKR